MQNFSPQILDFFKKAGVDHLKDITPVPKTKSCGKLGDFLIFRYTLGVGSGNRSQRIGMIVRPTIKLPNIHKTGNLLLTVVKVPLDQELTSLDLVNLYRNRRAQLPENDYRTYLLHKLYGPLYRLRVT